VKFENNDNNDAEAVMDYPTSGYPARDHPASKYPAFIDVQSPERLENWRPLVQWVLAIPHVIICAALSYVSGALSIVSWFAIVFTGNLPAGLANFQVFILRYAARTQNYAGFLHDSYPPFAFDVTAAEPGGTPVNVVVRPALTGRNRLTVGLRLLWAIPAALYLLVISIVGNLAWFAAFFAVLFTGRWPASPRDWVMRMQRVSLRFSAYANLLTDDYPPFTTD
jgi:Domain of unknown function (DUF4389)